MINRFCFLNITILAGIVLFFSSQDTNGAARELRSPNGKIAIIIHTDAPLGYSIKVDGKPVLLRSRIGLELSGDVKLGENPIVKSEKRKSADNRWENKLGKNRNVRDHYNELNVTIKEGDCIYSVIARAYNDGVAFRLLIPKQKGLDSFKVMRDATEFTFADDNQIWAGWNNAEGESRPEGGFIGSQEWRYLPNKLSGLNPNFKHGLPFLVETAAAYVAITESDLLDWSAMWLVPKAGIKNTLEIQLAPPIPVRPWKTNSPTGGTEKDKTVESTIPVNKGLVECRTPHNSPWRAFIIGRQPADMIQSDLVLNLSTPSKIKDDSWIKPGMSSWGTWWSDKGKNDLPTLKHYIDLAGDMGWPYQLSEIFDKSIVPDLVAYGKKKGVRIWLWYHFNDFIDSTVYKKEFPIIAKWGIAGLKIDFIDRDDQWTVNWYEDICRKAAENHLLIDFHGAYKPTGLIRTWPNQITREGIQGNEYNKWSERETPEHRATLPFTRVLAGPADYTPGGFVNRQPSQFKKEKTSTQTQGTRASELAMFILIESPFTVACDSYDNYKDKDGNYLPGMDFLKGLPTVWDETLGLVGEVGKYVAEVRRNGKNWYLAAISDSDARELTIPLKFLGAGKWKVTLWEDAPDSDQNAEHIVKNEKRVRSSDNLQLKLAPAGGTVAIISKVD
jgi:alpha-glucosidase